jgi:hypothetical protein
MGCGSSRRYYLIKGTCQERGAFTARKKLVEKRKERDVVKINTILGCPERQMYKRSASTLVTGRLTVA